MESLGKRSAAYACYIFINISWYLSCLVSAIFTVDMLFDYLNPGDGGEITEITVSISDSLVSINDPALEYLSMESADVAINLGYFVQQFPDLYLFHFGFAVLKLTLLLFGLYKFRSLLKSTVYENVFTEINIQRIKTIAFLVMALGPISWLHQYVIKANIGDFVAHMEIAEQISIVTDFMFAGLFVYALATVFEKGYEMYQELKLTV